MLSSTNCVTGARRARIMTKDDPCIGVCRWDARTGWCLGCSRTVPEIKPWRKTTPYRRTALLRELSRRVEQVAGQATTPLQDGKRTRRP